LGRDRQGGVGGRGRVRVVFDQDLLGRQVHERKGIVVATARDLDDLDRAAAVGQHMLADLQRKRHTKGQTTRHLNQVALMLPL
jgi:hypothetical protein